MSMLRKKKDAKKERKEEIARMVNRINMDQAN